MATLRRTRPNFVVIAIADLGAGGECVKVLSKKTFEQEWGGSVAKTELITVSVERGLSWESAMDVWRDHVGSDDGFYTSLNVSVGFTLILVLGLL